MLCLGWKSQVSMGDGIQNSKNASKIQKALSNVQQVSLWENPFNISQLYFGKEKNKKIEKK